MTHRNPSHSKGSNERVAKKYYSKARPKTPGGRTPSSAVLCLASRDKWLGKP